MSYIVSIIVDNYTLSDELEDSEEDAMGVENNGILL